MFIYLYIRFYYHRSRCLVGGWNISPVDNFAHWRGSRKCGAPQRASATPGSLEGGTRHQHLSHAQSWSLPFDMNSWPFRIWFTNIFTSKLEIVCFDRRTIMNHQNLFNKYFLITKGSVSYLSSPCFSTSLGGIGGPARGIHGILAVMYWISIIRGGPPPRKWSWVQFPRVTRSRAPTLEAHFPWGRCPCSPA